MRSPTVTSRRSRSTTSSPLDIRAWVPIDGSSSTTSRRAPEGSARTALSDTGAPGEREDDARPVAHTAIDPDRPGVRFDEPLRYRKTEPDAARALSRTREANKRLEDAFCVGGGDPRSVIADREPDVAVVAADADADLRACRRELRRVLDQVREDLLDLDVIQLDGRQVFGNLQPHRVPRRDRAHPPGDVFDQRADVMPGFVRHKGSVLDAREIEEAAHEPVEPHRLVLDGARALVTLALRPSHVSLPEAPGRREDARERRA